MKSESLDGVTASVNALSNKIDVLEKVVAELEEKLVDFVRPLGPMCIRETTTDSVDIPKSNIEATIKLFCERCDDLRAKVESLSYSIHP